MRITADNTITILGILQKAFPESSTTKLKKTIQLGCVSYKDAVVKHPEFILQKGESIEYKKYDPKRSFREKASIPVLFEDDDVLAVFKTMNVAMEGKSVNGKQSLLNAANSYVSRKRRRPIGLLPINYLKSNEAGIALFAKTAEAQRQFKELPKGIEKTYVALVEGAITSEKGTFEHWLLQLRNKSIKVVEKGAENATQTISEYKLLKRYNEFSYIEIKTNSSMEDTVRIHLGQEGFPVVGDRKYGADPELVAPLKLYNFRLNLTHPFTRQQIKIETAVPKSFLEGLE